MSSLPQRTRLGRGVCAVLVLAFVAMPSRMARAAPDPLEPRQPLAKPAAPPEPDAVAVAQGLDQRLVVKFHDRVLARSTEAGGLRSLAGADLAALLDALDSASAQPVKLSPLIDLPEDVLLGLERKAASRSGRGQPDLAGMLVVHAPQGALPAVAAALHASELVERTHFQALAVPPPGWTTPPSGCSDMSPATDGFRYLQAYHDAELGVDMPAAWAHPGGKGQGVRVIDCEYGFRASHEDLCGITPEPGIVVHPSIPAYGWDQHGTAVLGQLVGQENGYGVTGLVPEAKASLFYEWSVDGQRRVAAIAHAISSVDAGDVVLLEMQTTGPGGHYGPAELDPMVWTLTRLATDLGVCVVAAAGNGNQDLDSPAYAEYRSRGDSGAIIVGAGTSDSRRAKLGYSTHGLRVNLQGWGQNVFTTGYGDYVRVGGDSNQEYTHLFSGTSSASPIVAAAVVSLQGIHLAKLGRPLPPEQVRRILVETGRPQDGGGNIGPLPDMAAAVGALLASVCVADFDGDGRLTLFDFLAFQSAFDLGQARADLDGDGRLTLFDFLEFQSAFDLGCG